jgi:hypothetical protein
MEILTLVVVAVRLKTALLDQVVRAVAVRGQQPAKELMA